MSCLVIGCLGCLAGVVFSSWMSFDVLLVSCSVLGWLVGVMLSYWMSWMSCRCLVQFLDVLPVSCSVLGCLGCLADVVVCS